MKFYYKQEQKDRGKIFDILKCAAIKQWRTIKKSVFEELSKLAIFIQFLVPLFMVAFNMEFIAAIIISIATTCLTSYLRFLEYEATDCTITMPEPPRRFIEVDKDGFIGLKNENDIPELLQYMYELERYLESKGRLQD